MAERQAATRKKTLAYRGASRRAKARILDGLVELTGRHRDHERAALRDALVLKAVTPLPDKTTVSWTELLPALVKCWRSYVARRASR